MRHVVKNSFHGFHAVAQLTRPLTHLGLEALRVNFKLLLGGREGHLSFLLLGDIGGRSEPPDNFAGLIPDGQRPS